MGFGRGKQSHVFDILCGGGERMAKLNHPSKRHLRRTLVVRARDRRHRRVAQQSADARPLRKRAIGLHPRASPLSV